MTKIKGAEATLEINGKVVKKREAKNYRHEKLDTRIRKERTQKEKNLMKEARKHNVNVPEVEKVNDYTLEIEKLKGDQLKDVLNEKLESMTELGENTANLHTGDIIHGDLTTRNVMVNNKIYLIDFGLSERSQKIEDRAVDLHLLKQVLESSHPELAEEAWEKFLEGYKMYEKSEEVIERLKEVEQRGRYK